MTQFYHTSEINILYAKLGCPLKLKSYLLITDFVSRPIIWKICTLHGVILCTKLKMIGHLEWYMDEWDFTKLQFHMSFEGTAYRQVSNIWHTLVGD